jgi:tetratricopeptide (TPR) repeat protein
MKVSLIIFSVLLFTCASMAQGKYDDAVKAIGNKDYKTALNIAGDYLSHDSTDQAVRILVGLKAVDPNDKAVDEKLGDAYDKMNVPELALLNYQDAEKLDSLNIEIKSKIAKVYIEQRSYTDAANKYLQILSVDSTYYPAYYELGNILYMARQYPNSAYYLNKYLQKDTTNYKAYLAAAKSFYAIQNFSKTNEIALKGLSQFPNKVDLEKLAAISYVYIQNYNQAVSMLNIVPDSLFTADEYSRIGTQFQNGRQDSLAIIYYKKALTKDSTLTKLFQSIANLDLMSGKYDDAIVYYDKKIKVDSTSVSARVNKALCNISLKNYNDAKISLLKAIKLDSTYVTSYIWLARSYRLMDSTNQAIDVYAKLIKVADGNDSTYKSELAEAYGFSGFNYLVKKKYKAAIEPLKTAVSHDPGNFQYHLWLAEAYALDGNKPEAIKEYKMVLSLDPQNEDAKKGLKLLGSM